MNIPLAGFLALVGAVALGRRRRSGGLGSSSAAHAGSMENYIRLLAQDLDQLAGFSSDDNGVSTCRLRFSRIDDAISHASRARNESQGLADEDIDDDVRNKAKELARHEEQLEFYKKDFWQNCIGGSRAADETEAERMMKFFSTPGWRP